MKSSEADGARSTIAKPKSRSKLSLSSLPRFAAKLMLSKLLSKNVVSPSSSS